MKMEVYGVSDDLIEFDGGVLSARDDVHPDYKPAGGAGRAEYYHDDNTEFVFLIMMEGPRMYLRARYARNGTWIFSVELVPFGLTDDKYHDMPDTRLIKPRRHSPRLEIEVGDGAHIALERKVPDPEASFGDG